MRRASRVRGRGNSERFKRKVRFTVFLWTCSKIFRISPLFFEYPAGLEHTIDYGEFTLQNQINHFKNDLELPGNTYTHVYIVKEHAETHHVSSCSIQSRLSDTFWATDAANGSRSALSLHRSRLVAAAAVASRVS